MEKKMSEEVKSKKIKKAIIIIASLLIPALCCADADTKILLKDYKVNDPVLRPIGVGVCSWTDKEKTFSGGLYINLQTTIPLE